MFSGVGRSVKYQQKPLGNPRIVLSNQRSYYRLNLGIIWGSAFESIAGFYRISVELKQKEPESDRFRLFLFATIPWLSVP